MYRMGFIILTFFLSICGGLIRPLFSYRLGLRRPTRVALIHMALAPIRYLSDKEKRYDEEDYCGHLTHLLSFSLLSVWQTDTTKYIPQTDTIASAESMSDCE